MRPYATQIGTRTVADACVAASDAVMITCNAIQMVLLEIPRLFMDPLR